jgi:hypothetical protein
VIDVLSIKELLAQADVGLEAFLIQKIIKMK